MIMLGARFVIEGKKGSAMCSEEKKVLIDFLRLPLGLL
jgi:hypothetical protein